MSNSKAGAADIRLEIPSLPPFSKYVFKFLDSPILTLTYPRFASKNICIWLNPYMEAFGNKFNAKLVAQEARAMTPSRPFVMKFRSNRDWKTISIEGSSSSSLWTGVRGGLQFFFAIARVMAIEMDFLTPSLLCYKLNSNVKSNFGWGGYITRKGKEYGVEKIELLVLIAQVLSEPVLSIHSRMHALDILPQKYMWQFIPIHICEWACWMIMLQAKPIRPAWIDLKVLLLGDFSKPELSIR